MTKLIIITSFLSILFLFQNCENTEFQAENAIYSPRVENNQSDNNLDSNEVNNSNLLLQKPIKTFQFENQSAHWQDQFQLNINLVTRQVDLKSIMNNDSPISACLSEDDILVITDFFSSAKLCQKKPIDAKNLVCTMIYTPPFATVTTEDNETIALGERRNGCDEPLTFCENNKKEELNELMNELIEVLDERPCNL